MKQIVLVACLTALCTGAADAAGKRGEDRLETLDPMTRLEQICAMETMARVHRDKNPHRPDRAIIYALSAPVLNGDTVSGDGGAFRSKGKWYRYSFTCKATADHMAVSSFSYKIGDPIPEDQWETYGLY
ncbi:MAG: DUF930 domain-containing protein [Pseudomonadota bacterium]|jgi:hypothetical protein